MLSRRGECQINLGNKRGMPGAIVFVELSRFKGQHILCSWSPLQPSGGGAVPGRFPWPHAAATNCS